MDALANYGLPAGYQIRPSPQTWQGVDRQDDFQLEVYALAAEIMESWYLDKVLDIGTGGGWKLLQYLGRWQTVGTDIECNYHRLCEKYPDRQWLLSDLSRPCPVQDADLIIAADVIEHLIDPDALLRYIDSCRSWKFAVLSTPDRHRVRGLGHLGPPTNPCHVREWSAAEFQRYVQQWFAIRSTRQFRHGCFTVICYPPVDVSVLVPVYNTRRRWMEEFWRSLQEQTLQKWELVLVDDGSTLPECLEMIQQIAEDPRARLLRIAHSGTAAALNAGLRACRADLVARMDTDDIMLPERLEKQLQYMRAYPHVAILGTQMLSFDDITGEWKKQTKHPENVNAIQRMQSRQAWHGWFLNHPTVMFRRRRILALGGYNPSYLRAQDIECGIERSRPAIRSAICRKSCSGIGFRTKKLE